MGKDGTRLLVAINKRLNFLTQRDRKIQDRIDSNSLGNRCSIRLSYGTKLLIFKRLSLLRAREEMLVLPSLLPTLFIFRQGTPL